MSEEKDLINQTKYMSAISAKDQKIKQETHKIMSVVVLPG
jgi:hypothetical protein